MPRRKSRYPDRKSRRYGKPVIRHRSRPYRRRSQIALWVVVVILAVGGVLAYLEFRGPESTSEVPASATPGVIEPSSPGDSPMPTSPSPSTPVTSAAPMPTTTPSPNLGIPAATRTPIPVPIPTPTPTSVPALSADPSMRHLEEKRYMLELINRERQGAGLGPVVLGENISAQLHSEAALAGCHASHWGDDGLKPYMRYSLAGGYQTNAENGHGFDYCITGSDGYRAISAIETEIADAVAGWMMSPGHRDNMLDPYHRKVNLGLAWDRYNTVFFQHFEGDYVSYSQVPVVNSGILSLAGTTRNGVTFNDLLDLSVQVFYDSPPRSLTRGQLSRTYCYDLGLQVAAISPYPGSGSYTSTHDPCPNPYDVSPDASVPRSVSEAHLFWREANRASRSTPTESITVPWITARQWEANGNGFSLSVDLTNILARHGKGVYSLLIWGNVGNEDVVISQYSIFHEVTPPDTYSVGQH